MESATLITSFDISGHVLRRSNIRYIMGFYTNNILVYNYLPTQTSSARWFKCSTQFWNQTLRGLVINEVWDMTQRTDMPHLPLFVNSWVNWSNVEWTKLPKHQSDSKRGRTPVSSIESRTFEPLRNYTLQSTTYLSDVLTITQPYPPQHNLLVRCSNHYATIPTTAQLIGQMF